MIIIGQKIHNKFSDLEQEELYLKTCVQLGSKLNDIGSMAIVINKEAHAVNMKLYNYLEVHARNQMQWARNLKKDIKTKMNLQSELNQLIMMGV